MVKGWTRKPSHTSPATSVMCWPTPARNTFGGPNGLGPGEKNGVISVWRVELAAEAQLGAVVPGVPDGPHGQDELAHPGRRVRPRHREALLDVRLDLAAEAEDEAALGRQLQVVGRASPGSSGCGRTRRRSRSRARGARCARPASEQREERVVRRLRRPDPVVARRLLQLGHVCGVLENRRCLRRLSCP